MRERTSLRLLALLAPFVLFAAACGGDEPVAEGEQEPVGQEEGAEEEAADDVLVVGTLEKPSTLDPAEVYEKFASDILFNTTNRLVEIPAGESEVAPGLAESWEISEDGLTYTFQLREGVTFHDGSEMTSEDVKFSLERSMFINHPEGASFLLGGIQSIETPDPHTVVITLDEPNVTFLSRLNYTVASILPSDGVYPKPDALLEQAGDPPAAEVAEEFIVQEIVGTGPYELVDYSPDEGATLERFEDYWGEPAKIKTVKIQFFESTAQMKNALANGEIDLNMNDFGPAERAALESEEGVTVAEGPGARIRYVVLDVSEPPFDDPKVRRAMAAAIDRERIIEEVFEGGGQPLFSMIPSGYEVQEDFISDIDEELDEPVSFELWYPLNKYGDTEADLAETIARSLNESGQFNVTTKSADWASEFANNLRGGVYPAYLLGWYPDYIDPDDYIEPFYASYAPPYANGYSSPRMDELIAAEQQATDAEERAEVFREIQELAAEDMPYIPLFEQTPFAYYRDGLTGVEETLDAAQQARWFVIGQE